MIEFIHSHSATPLGYGPPYDRHRERKVDSMSNTPYQQPAPAPMPLKAMNNERALWKFIVFGLITCGIYPIVFWSGIGEDLNIAATRRDGKKTMHYCLVLFLLGPITCSIYLFVWFHQMSERLGSEARARGFATDFGASTFLALVCSGQPDHRRPVHLCPQALHGYECHCEQLQRKRHLIRLPQISQTKAKRRCSLAPGTAL